jgi:hypothetical protein
LIHRIVIEIENDYMWDYIQSKISGSSKNDTTKKENDIEDLRKKRREERRQEAMKKKNERTPSEVEYDDYLDMLDYEEAREEMFRYLDSL